MKENFQKILTLLKGIYHYNVLRYFKPLAPTELQINITYRCNSRCEMCHIWKMKPRNELTFAQWKKIMRDPIFSSIERLSIAGGEPTLHPGLIKLTKLFMDSMPRLQTISLITNGLASALAVPYVQKLAFLSQERGINLAIAVSLDGIGKMHDALRGEPGAFKKTSATILKLKSLQPKFKFWLSVVCMICRKNLYHLKEVEEWSRRNKVDLHFQLVGFHETYVQNMDKKNKLDFRDEDKKYLHSILKKLSLKCSWKNVEAYFWRDMYRMYKNRVLRSTPCSFLLDAFVLDSFGDVYYCLSERKIGNCRRKKSVSEIYYDSENLKFRRWMAENVCGRCNSLCFAYSAIKKDFKKFIWYRLAGKIWPFGGL